MDEEVATSTLTHMLLRSAEAHPEREALVYGARRIDFARLVNEAARFADALSGMRSRIVPILAFNSDLYFEYFLAGPWGGFVTCPLNWRWSVHEIVYALDECDSSVLLVGPGFEDVARSAAAMLARSIRLLFLGEEAPDDMESLVALKCAAVAREPLSIDGDRLSAIFYTGGSTGRPKGVMLSQSGIVASTVAMLVADEVRHAERYLRCTPMFHYADSAWSLAAMIRGGTNIIHERFDVREWSSAIAAEKITISSLVPSMIAPLCALDHAACGFDFGTLRHIVYGGSPISAELLGVARRGFPNAVLSQGYGMTEYTSNMTILSPQDHDGGPRLLSSAGRPNFATRLRIVDPETSKPVATGERGEVEVRGPQMMLGYHKSDDQTRDAFNEGWLRTGDIGFVDAENYLFIVDRLKDMIVTGGENVYSAEVERVLASHPAVVEVAVIGIPDDRWGEAVHAVVVLRAGSDTSVESLRTHCAAHIARFKVPSSIDVISAMPLTAFGKISKPDLRAPFWKDGRHVS